MEVDLSLSTGRHDSKVARTTIECFICRFEGRVCDGPSESIVFLFELLCFVSHT